MRQSLWIGILGLSSFLSCGSDRRAAVDDAMGGTSSNLGAGGTGIPFARSKADGGSGGTRAKRKTLAGDGGAGPQALCARDGFPGCHDDNPCTLNRCEATGCESTPLQDGTPCDDGDACTSGDSCQQGICQGFPFTSERSVKGAIRSAGAPPSLGPATAGLSTALHDGEEERMIWAESVPAAGTLLSLWQMQPALQPLAFGASVDPLQLSLHPWAHRSHPDSALVAVGAERFLLVGKHYVQLFEKRGEKLEVGSWLEVPDGHHSTPGAVVFEDRAVLCGPRHLHIYKVTDDLTWERAVELPPGAICTKLALTDSRLLLATSGGGYWADLDGSWQGSFMFEGPVLPDSNLAEFDFGAGRFVAHAFGAYGAPGRISLLSADGQVLDTLKSEYPLGFSFSDETVDVLERQREPCGSSLRRFDVGHDAFAETTALELERTGQLCTGTVPVLSPTMANDQLLAGLHAKFIHMQNGPPQLMTHSQHGSFERVLDDDSGRTYAQGPFSHRELLVDKQDGTLSTQEGGSTTSSLKVSPLRGLVTPQRGFLMGTVGSHVAVDESKNAHRTLLIDRLPLRHMNSPGELPLHLAVRAGALGSWCGRVVNAFAEDDVDHSWQLALTQLDATQDEIATQTATFTLDLPAELSGARPLFLSAADCEVLWMVADVGASQLLVRAQFQDEIPAISAVTPVDATVSNVLATQSGACINSIQSVECFDPDGTARFRVENRSWYWGHLLGVQGGLLHVSVSQTSGPSVLGIALDDGTIVFEEPTFDMVTSMTSASPFMLWGMPHGAMSLTPHCAAP